MQTYISILRGINVSGQKMIKMEELATLYKSLHFENVKTYIQSGNVVFQANQTDVHDLAKQIEERISERFGFQVPVMVKEKNEIASVLQNNPFIKSKEDVSRLHVTFLSNEPNQTNIDKIKQAQYEPDEYFILGSVVYLFCPNGYGNTKLTNNFFENKLKVTATTRNWKTVNELMNMANTLPDTSSS